MEDKHSFSSYFKRAVSPLLVLHVLRDGPMYGYEINQAMKRRSNDKLGLALLYPVLYKLEEDGYIYQTETRVENGRARTYFAMTPAGQAYLEEKSAEFRDLADTMLAILDGRA